MEKGDIVWGKPECRKDDYKHFIIFLKSIDEDSFDGALLTHASIEGNKKMLPEHFLVTNPNDKIEYEFQYDGGNRCTHLVAKYVFVKKINLVDVGKIWGRLSSKGIEFVNKELENAHRIAHKGPLGNLRKN